MWRFFSFSEAGDLLGGDQPAREDDQRAADGEHPRVRGGRGPLLLHVPPPAADLPPDGAARRLCGQTAHR